LVPCTGLNPQFSGSFQAPVKLWYGIVLCHIVMSGAHCCALYYYYIIIHHMCTLSLMLRVDGEQRSVIWCKRYF